MLTNIYITKCELVTMSIKFETKLNKLGINEEEVKSIIANCECGEINGAYFIELSKLRNMDIFEIVGNYLNHEERFDHNCEKETDWDYRMRMTSFCKAFGIDESQIKELYVLGFNEGGADICYTLESNEDVLLVLTDDERYTNSFIQFSPSQQTEEETETDSYTELFDKIKQAETELHEMDNYSIREKTEDGKGYIVDLNILDELILYHSLLQGKVIYDKSQMGKIIKSHTGIIKDSVIERISNDIDLTYVRLEFGRYNSSKSSETIENEVETMLEFSNEQERAGDSYTFCYDCNHNRGDDECNNCTYYDDESEENWITFKIISKEDERLYLAGEVDISSIDDEDGGDWSYEQNNGLFDSHLPSYWKVGSEDLSYKFSMFLNLVDWEIFRQYLSDFQDENKLIDCGDYILHINEGAN